MKLIRHTYVTALLAVAALAPSCSNDVECIFPESSANRIDAELARVGDILIGPANGWLVEYYPGPAQAYGGFNILMDFKFDGHVTIAGESAEPGQTATSTYTLKQSAGAVLSFDTYNSIFHYYSSPDSGTGTVGYGMEGDFEFLVISATDDEIVLKGKKSGSYAYMRPMSSYYKWSEYLKEVKEEAAKVARYNRMQYKAGDDTYEVRLQNKAFFVYRTNDEGEQYAERYAFIVNLMGCKFYKPIPFSDNDVVEGVVLNTQFGEDGAFIPTNDALGMFVPSYPTPAEYLTTKNWFFSYATAGYWTKSKWDVTIREFNKVNFSFTYCYLGQENNILGNYYAFNFRSSNGTGSLEIDYEILGEDRISFQKGRIATQLANELYSDYGLKSMIETIGDIDKQTFTLEIDDIRNPSWIKCIDEANPDNYFQLSRSIVYSPMNH